MYQESQKHIMTGVEAKLFSELQCEHPIQVTTRNGRKICVPCGSCCACRSRRRIAWAKRLVDESKDFRNIHSFGVTLTYDDKHLPYFPLDTLDWIKEHEHETEPIEHFYIQPNKSHSYLNPLRGKYYKGRYKSVSASCVYGSNVGLCCSLDMDKYIRSVREQFDKIVNKYNHRTQKDKLPDMIVRYYFISDYGELDSPKNGRTEKRYRTGRPHYHGIFFIQATSEEFAMEVRKNSNLLNNIALSAENIALNCWSHCKRFWDAKKQIWAGKSIQTFGENWGNYLGRYINKEENAKFSGCLGDKYVPERVWCSRMNTKYGFGSIGMSYFRPSLYAQYMAELDECVKRGCRWSPIYEENGYKKALPTAYKRYLLQNYFQFKFSELAAYIFQKNWVQKHPDCFRNVPVTVIDPNDPLGLLTTTVLEPRYVKMWQEYKKRKRNSIATLAKTEPKEIRYIDWFPQAYKAFEAYLAFADKQTDLWIDAICVDDLTQMQYTCYLQDGMLYPFVSEQFQTDPGFIGACRMSRTDNLAKCKEIKDKAIERKHVHEIRNKYVV